MNTNPAEAAAKQEQEAIANLFKAYRELIDLGWQEVIHCQERGPSELVEIIAAGSTGIHQAYRDEMGFWIVEPDDVSPADAIVWRPIKDN